MRRRGRGNIWVPLLTQSAVRGRRLSQTPKRPTYPIRLGRPPDTAKSDPERSPLEQSEASLGHCFPSSSMRVRPTGSGDRRQLIQRDFGWGCRGLDT